MKKYITIIFFILIIFLTIIIRYHQTNMHKKIDALITIQEHYIRQQNMKGYLSTISKKDSNLYTEKKNWFRDLCQNPIDNYDIQIINVKQVNKTTAIAKIKQSFWYSGKPQESIFTCRYEIEGNQWKDSGIDFKSIRKGEVVVKYFPSQTSIAKRIMKDESTILADLREKFKYEPLKAIEIKLFNNDKLFRQSVKLSLPSWVGGWNEYGESIKVLISSSNPYQINETLAHETIHHMVSDLSNDNASYWFQEGMAGYFMKNIKDPSQNLTQEDCFLLSQLLKKNQLKTLNQLENTNLETLTDDLMVSGYYIESKVIIHYLYKKYGFDTLIHILQDLKEMQAFPGTAAEKIKELNHNTKMAIEKNIGISYQQFDDNFYQYMIDEINKT